MWPSKLSYSSGLALVKPNSYDSVGHGLLVFVANDCNRQALAGVTFTTTAEDPLMQPFFVINPTPSIVDEHMDGLGRGGFVNVSSGLHTFTAEFAATKRKIGSARVLQRAGAAITLSILPSP